MAWIPFGGFVRGQHGSCSGSGRETSIPGPTKGRFRFVTIFPAFPFSGEKESVSRGSHTFTNFSREGFLSGGENGRVWADRARIWRVHGLLTLVVSPRAYSGTGVSRN